MLDYNEMGYVYGQVPEKIMQAERERIAEKIRREDEERARSRRAFAVLCGMASPIIRPID